MGKRGLLLVISGPSGVGKGTLCKRLVAESTNLCLSISATTRAPRVGEIDGTNYFFVTHEEFARMIAQNELLEWASVFGNYYGTPQAYVEQQLAQGKNVVLEIDVQGAMKVKQTNPDAVMIFILPPCLEELRLRICKRGTESPASIEQRLSMVATELSQLPQYDYAVVNDEVDRAIRCIQAIIQAEECRVSRLLRNDEIVLTKEVNR